MEISDKRVNGTTILQLRGRLDAYEAPAIEKLLQKANVNTMPRIIVDLADVNFIDSTGLAMLIVGLKHCEQQHGKLVLCSVRQPVHIIFELTRLDKVFTMYGSQEDAIEMISEPA
jgi:anti-sigma B factor antagonist